MTDLFRNKLAHVCLTTPSVAADELERLAEVVSDAIENTETVAVSGESQVDLEDAITNAVAELRDLHDRIEAIINEVEEAIDEFEEEVGDNE